MTRGKLDDIEAVEIPEAYARTDHLTEQVVSLKVELEHAIETTNKTKAT